MGIRVGSVVKAGESKTVCEVENIYTTPAGDTFVTVVRPDGNRQIWDWHSLELVPDDTKKVTRRMAVDRILSYGGVPRDYLYEYPYNDRRSDQILAKAEKLLDDLMEILGTNGRC